MSTIEFAKDLIYFGKRNMIKRVWLSLNGWVIETPHTKHIYIIEA